MAKDTPRRTGKYKLPVPVYHQTLWIMRDYYRLKDNLDSLSVLAPIEIDDMPKSKTNRTNDLVFNIVLKREEFADRIRMIDRAMATIPPEYRKGVWDSIHFGKPYPRDAHRTTYSRYKSKVLYILAKNLNLI